MALAEALHHSSGLRVMERVQHAALRGQKTGTRAGVAGPAPVPDYVAPAPAVAPFSTPAVTYDAPAPVIEYAVPTPAVTYAAPAPVVGFDAPAPSVTYAAPAPVFEYVAPAPVSEYIVPAPAVFFVAPSQQLRPAYSAAAVTTGVNRDAEFVVSASQVVGSLPHGEVFAVPVFHQVHHGLRAGVDIPENLVDPPVVPGQGDFLRVVARRPPPLVDVMPSSRFHRHIMEDLGELAPSVQLLDLPVPQMVDQPVDILKIIAMLLPAVDEQVIDVPKIIQDSTPQRLKPPEPQQLVEQLVEVPTVLTPTRIALQIAEQIVDTPVPRGRVHGSLPRQSSAARTTSARRRFTGRIWHMPVAELYGFIESDEGDVPFFLAGSCQLGDLVTFAVGRGADGLEAYDLKVVGRG